MLQRAAPSLWIFLSTPSARRATCTFGSFHAVTSISIHALREEGDLLLFAMEWMLTDFYPRPPRGGRPTTHGTMPPCGRTFLSTPSARRATKALKDYTMGFDISIHALREEGDTKTVSRNVTALRFLSTPSARRATNFVSSPLLTFVDFYPRPPRGGRPHDVAFVGECILISIHALREEGDPARPDLQIQDNNFYPRPPRGGRQKELYLTGTSTDISIHALREEGDGSVSSLLTSRLNFYPRPPRGGRRSGAVVLLFGTIFLSTPSARRATHVRHAVIDSFRFLSTPSARRAPRAGAAPWPSRGYF